MEYYFSEEVDNQNKKLIIRGEESHHLINVLRKGVGNKISVTDGKYNIYNCLITYVEKDYIECKIAAIDRNLFEPDLKINLCLSHLKNQTRFEFAVEKAVELGVYSITPVITEHSEVKLRLKSNKTERLKKIIKSAVKQSQRCLLPELSNSLTLDELVLETKDAVNKVVMYEFADSKNVSFKSKCSNEMYLLIGPEGGFSEKEINKLKDNFWNIQSLGMRKLRAETAAIAAVNNFLNNN